jgi:predicted RNA-binding Zn ribbon-like protein
MTRTSPVQRFQFIAGNLALDFINTVADRLGESRDYLNRPADIVRWAQEAGLHGRTTRFAVGRKQLRLAVDVREGLHALFQATALGSSGSQPSLGWLNAKLATVMARRQVTWEKGRVSWRWNSDASHADSILGPVLTSATDLLVTGLYRSVGQCDDEACGWLFLDRSRSARRRWCSMADCGNRAKARKFYHQQLLAAAERRP